jgi:hypothetical protein
MIADLEAVDDGAGRPRRAVAQDWQAIRAWTPLTVGELVDVVAGLLGEEGSRPSRS